MSYAKQNLYGALGFTWEYHDCNSKIGNLIGGFPKAPKAEYLDKLKSVTPEWRTAVRKRLQAEAEAKAWGALAARLVERDRREIACRHEREAVDLQKQQMHSHDVMAWSLRVGQIGVALDKLTGGWWSRRILRDPRPQRT